MEAAAARAQWVRFSLLAIAALLSVLGVGAPFFVPVLRDARHNALVASLATAGVVLVLSRGKNPKV